jgi:chitinase
MIWWTFNYGPAGKSIGVDLLADPDRVAKDPVVSFKKALWLWMNSVHQVMPKGFGATTRASNSGLACDGKNPPQVKTLVGYYKQYASSSVSTRGTTLPARLPVSLHCP